MPGPVPFPVPVDRLPSGGVRILDQTKLPGEERYVELATVDAVAEAIASLRVRGAPLIGIVAAMGVVQALRDGVPASRVDALAAVQGAADRLAATRPTAVNLRWALDRMRRVAESTPGEVDAIRGALVREADAILEEDRAMCERIGRLGATLFHDDAVICTICNAGALATGGMGTALAPVYTAHAAGRRVAVIVPETRPLLQGSRLTAWELTRAGIPVTVIADGMIASRLRHRDVTCVFVGADRIAANGDVANKIGTYGLALAARAHGIPFYVAAPSSTIDFQTPDGARIPIEERDTAEVTRWGDRSIAPAGVAVWNPAFDVTPAELVTAIVTDAGIFPPHQLPR